MRVLIVNTSERTGGAALAANRLLMALNNNGVKARMLVRDKSTDDLLVSQWGDGWRGQWNFLRERLAVWWRLRLGRKHLWDLDVGCAGSDITRTREFQEADVVHLHWVNQGMLSLNNIRRILDSGKRVVWTMHDMWPATALCHLTLTCRQFTTGCCHCPYLPGGGSENDAAAAAWRRKQSMLEGHRITFVACSQWLAGEARQSALLKGQRVVSIPNAIDTTVFHPADRRAMRQQLGLPAGKKLIAFVSQRATNPYKGMDYLAEACRLLGETHPQLAKETGLVVLGGHAEEVAKAFQMPVFAQGYVNDAHRIAALYSACDLFVLPSLSENLPNTIMEAMACGVPCVGFRTGGIPEMIDHKKNGYVANYRDADDLARGLAWVLSEANAGALATEAQRKVTRCWSQGSVAKRYIEVYEGKDDEP
ncbi:MAG: glycosyltransferase family 4 protein [Prevotella sp.]|nr:glycosyltransferase family 4 protein [Prevotella sp.]